ncbi:MAG: response regulator transcription factor [Bradymonadia bacterium]
MRVLIAEDDPLIRTGLTEILEGEGYTPLVAVDGPSALTLYGEERPDFVLLDIMMPGMSGYDVCRRIRAQDEGVPIIFISAKSEEIDRVLGLELGADDFIMKPFGVKEVIARIRAVTRRAMARKPGGSTSEADQRRPFELGPWTIYPEELRARRPENTVELSLREVAILRLLVERRGRVVDRETFFRTCWGLNHMPNSRTLDQHVSKLRKRIEDDPRNPVFIQTVHGVGYRFE